MNRTNQNTQMDAVVLTIEQMSWRRKQQEDNNKAKKTKKNISTIHEQKRREVESTQQIAWNERRKKIAAKIKIYILTK